MAPKRNQPQADSPCVGDSTLKHHCYEMISKLSKVGSNSRTNKGIEHVLVMSLRGGSLMCRVHNFLLILGFWFMQVLAEELESLKRQRAQMRAASRALAQQEKNVKKRRARLLQAVFFVKRFFIPPWLHLPHEAARQLSQEDLVLLPRQPGGASPTDLDLDLKSSPSILPGGAVPAPPYLRLRWLLLLLLALLLLPQVTCQMMCLPEAPSSLQLRAFEAVNFDMSS